MLISNQTQKNKTADYTFLGLSICADIKYNQFVKAMFTIKGKVVKGKNRGKALGFPTVNLVASPTLPQGIYVSTTEIDGNSYQSVTFIGTVDTYGESEFVVETFILNFDQDIYGKVIKVNMLKKLRENKKFDSESALIAQIADDKKKAEEYFKSYNSY